MRSVGAPLKHVKEHVLYDVFGIRACLDEAECEENEAFPMVAEDVVEECVEAFAVDATLRDRTRAAHTSPPCPGARICCGSTAWRKPGPDGP